MPKYIIEDMELPTEYRDEGPWRCYHLDTHGENIHELLLNASIVAVDQDGGELYVQTLDQVDGALAADVERAIAKAVAKS